MRTKFVQWKHPSDKEKHDDGDQDIDRRSRDRDDQLLPGIGRHSLQARNAANGQQSDVRSPNPKSLCRESVAKLMQQHAKKDQQCESHSIHRRLRAAFRVINPSVEAEEQQKSEVDSHLNAGNGCYAIGPFHASGTMAEQAGEASVFGREPCLRPNAIGKVATRHVSRQRWRAALTSSICQDILAGSMQVPKVLVADPVSQRGLDEIATGGELEVVVKTGLSEAEIIKLIPEFSALVVRSQTKVTAAVLEAAKKLEDRRPRRRRRRQRRY